MKRLLVVSVILNVLLMGFVVRQWWAAERMSADNAELARRYSESSRQCEVVQSEWQKDHNQLIRLIDRYRGYWIEDHEKLTRKIDELRAKEGKP